MSDKKSMIYDAVIILGSKLDIETLKFPSHIYAALDKAAEFYANQETEFIVLSGNYALRFDRDGTKVPARECDLMAKYLLEKGVPESALLLEGISKDTVANFYYVKREVLAKHELKKLLFIAAEFREERIKFLAAKILGTKYDVSFLGVSAAVDEVNPTEDAVLQRTQNFLSDMKDGDDSFLDGVFYNHKFYHRPKK